jgi:integrase
MSSTSYGATSRQPLTRPNGSRVPNAYERTLTDGTVVAEFNGRGPDGKMTKRTFKAATKTERIRLVEGFAADLERGQVVIADRTVTVAELVDQFITHLETRVGSADPKFRMAPRTKLLYEQRLTQHILPALGRRKLADISTADLRSLVDKLRSKQLAPSTINGTLVAFGSALRFAVKRGLIPTNPMLGLDRDDRPGVARQSEPRYLAEAEIDALLVAAGDSFRAVLAACANGLRISEALGLRWRDVDFDAKTIRVEGQLGLDGTRSAITKTSASKQVVPMLPRTERELRAWRSQQAELGIDRLGADALVFSTKTGKPQIRRNCFRALTAAAVVAGLNGAGVEPLGLHDLRHSFASSLFATGFSLPEVSTLLRHKSVAVTASVYSGLSEPGREALHGRLLAAGVGA